MASENGRPGSTLNLDDLFPPPLELVFHGKTHRVPGEAFTMEVVMRIQHLMQEGGAAADDPNLAEKFMDDLREHIEKSVIARATPRLHIGGLPASVIVHVAGRVIQHAFGVEADAGPPPPPNRAARRSTSRGTSQTKR